MPAPRFTVALLLSAALMAGCGGDDADDAAQDAPPETTQAAPEAEGTPESEATPESTPEEGDAGVPMIPVALTEWDVRPESGAEAGDVMFHAQNIGQFPHNLEVIRTETDAGDFPVENLRARPDGEMVGRIRNVGPGDMETLDLELEPGHYALICNLPGHYERGMHANYEVE